MSSLQIDFDQLPTYEELWDFYRWAMIRGWASEEDPNLYIRPHPILRGCKIFEHSRATSDNHSLILHDWWGGGRGGTTVEFATTSEQRVLLLALSCEGSYHECAIASLKEILLNAWRTDESLGGRGPAWTRTNGGITYINTLTGEPDDFILSEALYDDYTGSLGSHHFRGMMPIKLRHE